MTDSTNTWHYGIGHLMAPLSVFFLPILLYNQFLYFAILFLFFSFHLWNWEKLQPKPDRSEEKFRNFLQRCWEPINEPTH